MVCHLPSHYQTVFLRMYERAGECERLQSIKVVVVVRGETGEED